MNSNSVMSCCDSCAFYAYDEEYEDYFCTVNLDEDEYYKMQSGYEKSCSHYRNGDEYAVVRKQN